VPVKDLIGRWYREMSLRFHPDRGGSDEAMQAINHAHDRLKELAGV
jgi:curved DNA-binding protein CbpA